MCKCILTNEELPENNVNLFGFECRASGRYCCPNYMHNMVNGRNCRLLQKNNTRFAKLSLRSVLEPIKEVYGKKSKEELETLFSELHTKYKECGECQNRVLLRAQLGAIEELLEERKYRS